MPNHGPVLRTPASLRRPRFRGLLVLTALAVVVQSTLVITGSVADEGCGGSSQGVFALDSALAAGEPCADLKATPAQVTEGGTVSFDASASRPAAGGAGGGAGGARGTAFAAALTAQPVQRSRRIAKRGLALACQANRAATCKVSAMVSSKDARRLGLKRRAKRSMTIGSATVALRGAGSAKVVIKLSRKAQRAIKRARKVRVLIIGVATGGSARASLGRTGPRAPLSAAGHLFAPP